MHILLRTRLADVYAASGEHVRGDRCAVREETQAQRDISRHACGPTVLAESAKLLRSA